MEKWWHAWDNITSLIVAGSGAGVVILHVILQANGLTEVSKYLDGIGLTGSVGVMAMMGSGLFAALQRQTAYLKQQTHQGEKMIVQGEKAPKQVAQAAQEGAKEGVKQAIEESVRVDERRG